MKEEEIPDLNVFMMCEALNFNALSELPEGLFVRNCRPDELDVWKAFPFDDAETAKEYHGFMTDFLTRPTAEKRNCFLPKHCSFVMLKTNRLRLVLFGKPPTNLTRFTGSKP